jgi:hypothetical protein
VIARQTVLAEGNRRCRQDPSIITVIANRYGAAVDSAVHASHPEGGDARCFLATP